MMSVPRHSLLLLMVALLLGFLLCPDTTSAPTRTATAARVASGADRVGRPAVARAGKGPVKPPRKPKAEEIDLNDLHLEVVALQVLADLQVTPAQLKALAAVAES